MLYSETGTWIRASALTCEILSWRELKAHRVLAGTGAMVTAGVLCRWLATTQRAKQLTRAAAHARRLAPRVRLRSCLVQWRRDATHSVQAREHRAFEVRSHL